MAFFFERKRKRDADVHRLEDLEIKEISFVVNGANPGAKLMMLKHKDYEQRG